MVEAIAASIMRIAVIGNSGSGKSTVARQLSSLHTVEVLDLDTVVWEPGQVAVMRPAAAAVADLVSFCESHESWIVEGCYTSLVKETFGWEPELWFLDPGVDTCISNCRSRQWEPHKYASKEEQDEKLPFLVEWVTDYYSRDGDMSLGAHIDLYEGYTGVKRRITDLQIDLGRWESTMSPSSA